MNRYDPDGIVTFSQRGDGAYVKHEEVRASTTPLYATINDAGMTVERYTADA